MVTIQRVEVTPNLLSLFLSNNTVCSFNFTHTHAGFLATATPPQAQNWHLLQEGQAVVWPELQHTLTVKQLLKTICYQAQFSHQAEDQSNPPWRLSPTRAIPFFARRVRVLLGGE